MAKRRNKRPPKQTVLTFCTRRLGAHRGAQAASRIAMWATVTADLGRVPTTVEYADWWSVDERTGWRHRALVHEALEDHWQPVIEELAAWINAQEQRSLRDLQQAEVLPA